MDLSKTLPIKTATFSLTQNPTKKYPRSYKPHELGFNFPEVANIFLDCCGAERLDPYHFAPIGLWDTAHTHKCPLEPLINSICIPKRYLNNSDGTPTDMMWHEYGHVLASNSHILLAHSDTVGSHIVVNKDGAPIDFEEYQDQAHGEEWQQIMVRLGKPHIRTRLVSEPY